MPLYPHNKIAVVMPIYNVATYLRQALLSVTQQDYPLREIIVVDDGSAEAAAAEIKHICAEFPEVTLLREPHGGVTAARNAGIAHATSGLIYFLDADDILLPGALRYFADFMERNPQATAAYARFLRMNEQGEVFGEPWPPEEIMASSREVLHMLLANKMLVAVGTVCIRKQALEALDINITHLRYGEDWVLWCHLALAGNVMSAGTRVVKYYRKHPQSVMARFHEDPQNMLLAYEAVYHDPRFADAVGAERLQAWEEGNIQRVHIVYASRMIAAGNTEAVKHHWQQIRKRVSPILTEAEERRRESHAPETGGAASAELSKSLPKN
jgi:glycosyltransferase involved in cell wall biosynthesis